ncbi:MAG: glycosyltransferase family 2 protein [Actinobacteria bacterium]|nr:glycosyltransferase family 2 protein [Actinomycetota bacterium]
MANQPIHSIRGQSVPADVLEAGLSSFALEYPAIEPARIAALICAFEEEANIGAVLDAMPADAGGIPMMTIVVVDGGSDQTAAVARTHGMQLGIEIIVTLDADGQNDPAEIPALLEPILADTADFVVASRRLGVDTTTDPIRKLGVRVFSSIMNAMTGATLTDTSNGYRAFKTAMAADVVDRLRQPQFQTAELLITSLRRGWRVDERPTVWHPRASGKTKKGRNWKFGFNYAAVVFGTYWRER